MAINASPTRKLAIAKRRAILMQLVHGASTDMTYNELAEAMRKNSWVKARWPEYSIGTVMNDFKDNLSLMEDDIRSLAGIYMVRQLEVIDRAIERLESFADDEELKEGTRISAMNALGPFIDKELRIFGNYAAAELKVDKREIKINLDAFQRMKQKVEQEMPNIIDIEENIDIDNSIPLLPSFDFNDEEE